MRACIHRTGGAALQVAMGDDGHLHVARNVVSVRANAWAGFRVAVGWGQAETCCDAHVGDSLCRLLSADLGYDATLELRAHKGESRTQTYINISLSLPPGHRLIPSANCANIRRSDCARLELLSGTGCVGGGDGEKGDGLGGLSANKRANSPNSPSDGAVVIDRTEAAGARCFSWRAGAVAPHAASAILLARGSANPPKFAEALGGQIVQLCATYTTAGGGKRVRVTTLRLPRLPRAVPPAQLLGAISAIYLGDASRPFISAMYLGSPGSFDWHAAAALFTRLAVVKLEGGDPPADMVKWLDKVHIGLMQV